MNPLAVFVASLVLALVVLLSLDPVSASLVFVLGLIGALALKVPWSRLAVPVMVLIVSGLLGGLTTALYGRPSGEVFLSWGLVQITAGSLQLAGAIALRILAIGLVGIVALASTTPARLADALGQVWRLPARFVLGALASMRLVVTLRDDWNTLAMARRARGLVSPHHPWGSVAALPPMTLALFVRAIRRANLLATVMEARGLDNAVPRTWAHPSVWRRRDWLLVGISVAVAGAIVATGLVTGTWGLAYG